MSAMENEIDLSKPRKSLAVDVLTYNLLQDICNFQRRTKIDQLKVLIEREHEALGLSETAQLQTR